MLRDLVLLTIPCCLGAVFIGRASLTIMRRLGLDPVATLEWLGLAEKPLEVPRTERTRLREVLPDYL